MINEILVGTLALIGGGALAEARNYLVRRRNRKAALAEVLDVLLEARRQALLTREIMAYLRRILKGRAYLAGELLPPLRQAFPEINGGDLAAKFDAAVDRLRPIYPVLAHSIRHKNKIAPLIERVGTFSAGDPSAANLWAPVNEAILKQGIKVVERLALELARLHGRSSRRATEALFSEQTRMPQSFRNAQNIVSQQVEKQLDAQGVPSFGTPA